MAGATIFGSSNCEVALLTDNRQLGLTVGLVTILSFTITLGTALNLAMTSSLSGLTSSLGLLCTLGSMRGAIHRVEIEYERTRAEITAFDEFCNGIKAVSTEPAEFPKHTVYSSPIASGATTDSSRIEDVLQVYRDTVMSVPHFKSEYAEDIRENMSQELGGEVTTSLVTAEQFIPQLKDGLITGAENARQQRVALLEQVDSERAELLEVNEEFQAILSQVETIEDTCHSGGFALCESNYNRLTSLNEKCNGILQTRQESLQNSESSVSGCTFDDQFYRYLYEPLQTAHPIMETGTKIVDRINESKHIVVDRLCSIY